MKCRVCGKEYFCCFESKKIGSWREVACSTDCYKVYIELIGESRKPKSNIGDTIQTEINESVDNKNGFTSPKCSTTKDVKRKNKVENTIPSN